MAKDNTQEKFSGLNLDFKARLWAVADKPRGRSLRRDLPPNLKADFIHTNCNLSFHQTGAWEIHKELTGAAMINPSRN